MATEATDRVNLSDLMTVAANEEWSRLGFRSVDIVETIKRHGANQKCLSELGVIGEIEKTADILREKLGFLADVVFSETPKGESSSLSPGMVRDHGEEFVITLKWHRKKSKNSHRRVRVIAGDHGQTVRIVGVNNAEKSFSVQLLQGDRSELDRAIFDEIALNLTNS